jgi:hypothetical protein
MFRQLALSVVNQAFFVTLQSPGKGKLRAGIPRYRVVLMRDASIRVLVI